MNEKKATLFNSVLWGVIALFWAAKVCMDYWMKATGDWHVVLDILTAAAAIANFVRYRSLKNDQG